MNLNLALSPEGHVHIDSLSNHDDLSDIEKKSCRIF